MALATNKVKFKTNRPILLPVQAKTWGYHEAVPMNHDEVFKLLAGGAEDITMVGDDGTETLITWENLETYFPREEQTTGMNTSTTFEPDHTDYDMNTNDTFTPPFDKIDEPVAIPSGPTINVPVDQFVDKESGEAFLPGMVDTIDPSMEDILGDGAQVEEPGDIDGEAPSYIPNVETDINKDLENTDGSVDGSTTAEDTYVEAEESDNDNAAVNADEGIATTDEVW